MLMLLGITVLLHLPVASSIQSSPSKGNQLAAVQPTIFLPYAEPFSSSSTPLIRGSIDGKQFTFPMDTGRTGVLIGAPLLPNIVLDSTSEPNYERGWHFLDTSSLLYSGRFVPLNMSLDGVQGNLVVTNVPVLVVQHVVKCSGYDSTTDTGICPASQLVPSNASIDRVINMGVGFGRNGPENSFETPDRNPFLNIVSINGLELSSLRTGYTVSTNGVYLGLTWWNTRGAVWTELQRGATSDLRDWAMLDMASTVGGTGGGTFAGKALIDTSISQMYLQSSPAATLPNVTVPVWDPSSPAIMQMAKRVAPLTHLEFAFPDFENGVAGYDFDVGDRVFPSQPKYVEPISNGHRPFVNTGRNFLLGFTVAFDAVAGRFGFLCARCLDDRSLI